MCARKGGLQRAGDDDDDDNVGGGDGGDGGGGGGGVLVKKPVITRLDSELADRKIRSSPPEDNTRDAKGVERTRVAPVVDFAAPFFAFLSAN